MSADVLRQLALVGARISGGQRLEETLQAVADGVVESLGFGCVAVNYVLPNADFQVVAVAGSEEARELLDGQVTSAEIMETLLRRAESWGPVRFVSHDIFDEAVKGAEPVYWIPDLPVSEEPDAWHPEDVLLAPLQASDGTLVGLLSLDLPPGGRRPGPLLCELLGVFAVQAGVAIATARLTEALLAEREQLRRERSRLQASEAAFRFTFTASTGGMATLELDRDATGEFRQVNDAFCRLVGYRHDELDGLGWRDLALPEDHPDIEERVADFADGRRRELRGELRVVHRDGRIIWVSLLAGVIDADALQQPFLLVQVEDITERRSRQTALEEQALRDPLTGLPNRRLLLAHLRTVVERTKETDRPGALLYCDLDHFKQINDVHGHGAGDLALREVASRLQGQVRGSDVVARLGGDEFVVVAEDLDGEATMQLADRIRWAFHKPLTAVPATPSMSVGTTTIDGSNHDPADLLHQADLAMYADKRRGRTMRPTGS